MSLQQNKTAKSILLNMLLAFVSLFINGFGVYLTINANIGAGPWDVFNLGLSKTFGILYGNASIAVSFAVLMIDIAMHEPIGIAMFIDAVTVGKTVDLFNYLEFVRAPDTLAAAIVMLLVGLTIMGYTQFLYMRASLGCGPRDTLLVGLKRHCRKLSIGAISVIILSVVTLIGYLLGGPVGIGTLMCAFVTGPIMQLCFHTLNFDATQIQHQRLHVSLAILLKRPV